jgi:hypothetical protein
MSNAPRSQSRDRLRQEGDEREVQDALLHPDPQLDWVAEGLSTAPR